MNSVLRSADSERLSVRLDAALLGQALELPRDAYEECGFWAANISQRLAAAVFGLFQE